MAKKLREEDIALNIIINGNQAQKEIFELEKANRALKESQSEIKKQLTESDKELKKLNQTYASQEKKINELEVQKKELNNQYEIEEKKLKEIEISLGKTSKEYKLQEKVLNEVYREAKKVYDQSEKMQWAHVQLNGQITQSTNKNKKLKSEYNSLDNQIRKNVSRINELSGGLKVNEMTLAQLESKAKQLRYTLRHMVDGVDYRKMASQLAEVNNRIDELKSKAKQTKLTWQSAADWLNRYQTLLFSLVATLSGVVFSFQKWLDYAGKLSDAQSDVVKTTGMTIQEVEALTKSLGVLQTRTNQINLLKIAEEGGRIGIAKNEMESFVRVMDKASVALGDSFTGGVEEVSSVLGKLKFLFEETKDLDVDLAYNAIGSAINNLGADGVASERNIAEFATRLGSLPKQIKPTIAEALALGAAFEESGIDAEIAARAYSIFLKQATDPKKMAVFANVLGVSVDTMRKMIDENPVEFFLQFGEALSKSNISASQMSKLLQDLGINADGANKIVGAISNNSKRFREQIDLSNKSMAEANSLTNEFNAKNNNAAALLEKISKKVRSWFTSDVLIEWLESSVLFLAKLIGATDDADGSGKRWRETIIVVAKVLTILVAGIASYNAGMKMYTIWTSRATAGSILFNLNLKIQNALTLLAITRTQLLTAANALFTKGVRAAWMEVKALNTILGLSPWGLIATLIGVAVSAVVLYRTETEKTLATQKMLNEVNAEAEKSISRQRHEVEMLVKIARDENLEQQKRIDALNKLNEIIPGYNHLLNLEKINTLEATAAVKKYTDELRKNARVKALQSKYDQLEADRLDVENKTSHDYESNVDTAFRKIWSLFGVETIAYKNREEIEKYIRSNFSNLSEKEIQDLVDKHAKQSGILTKEQEINQIKVQQELIEKQLYQLQTEGNTLKGTDDDDDKNDFEEYEEPKKDKKSKVDNAKKEFEELLRERKSLNDELLKLQRENEDAQLEIMDDGFEKEMAKLKAENKRRQDDLRAQIVDDATIVKLESEKQLAKQKGDTKKVDLLDDIINSIKLKNEELYNGIIQSQLVFQYKAKTLHAKYASEIFKEHEKNINELKSAREKSYNEELIELGTTEAIKAKLKDKLSRKELDAIKTWEDAKKALKREHDKEEIENEINHVQNLINELENAVAKGSYQNIDLKLLSDEQLDEFLKNIEKLKEKLIELGVIKADLANQGLGTENSVKSYGSSKVDILGLSQNDWQLFIENIRAGKFELEELSATIGMLQNAFSQYYSYVQANEQRNLQLYERSVESQRRSLKNKLDRGVIDQKAYDKELEKIEKTAEKRRAEIEYRGAMAQYRQNMMNAAAGTALMIINAAQTKPFIPAGLAMAGVAAGMGALQIATIAKQKPIKGYEDGLYGKDLFSVIREQDGKKFNARYGGDTRSGIVDRPTVFMAGERGPELIVDNIAFRQLNPNIKDDFLRELARVKGFEKGFYPETKESTNNSTIIDESLLQKNIELLEQLHSLFKTIDDEGGLKSFIVMDYSEIKKLKKRMAEYDKHISQNKK